MCDAKPNIFSYAPTPDLFSEMVQTIRMAHAHVVNNSDCGTVINQELDVRIAQSATKRLKA